MRRGREHVAQMWFQRTKVLERGNLGGHPRTFRGDSSGQTRNTVKMIPLARLRDDFKGRNYQVQSLLQL